MDRWEWVGGLGCFCHLMLHALLGVCCLRRVCLLLCDANGGSRECGGCAGQPPQPHRVERGDRSHHRGGCCWCRLQATAVARCDPTLAHTQARTRTRALTPAPRSAALTRPALRRCTCTSHAHHMCAHASHAQPPYPRAFCCACTDAPIPRPGSGSTPHPGVAGAGWPLGHREPGGLPATYLTEVGRCHVANPPPKGILSPKSSLAHVKSTSDRAVSPAVASTAAQAGHSKRVSFAESALKGGQDAGGADVGAPGLVSDTRWHRNRYVPHVPIRWCSKGTRTASYAGRHLRGGILTWGAPTERLFFTVCACVALVHVWVPLSAQLQRQRHQRSRRGRGSPLAGQSTTVGPRAARPSGGLQPPEQLAAVLHLDCTSSGQWGGAGPGPTGWWRAAGGCERRRVQPTIGGRRWLAFHVPAELGVTLAAGCCRPEPLDCHLRRGAASPPPPRPGSLHLLAAAPSKGHVR